MKFGLECFEGDDSNERILMVSVSDEAEPPDDRWLDFEDLDIRIPVKELRRLLYFQKEL